ncbi:HK97-gp10 family putative phage morphogenesis protein [Bacillus smithii]|uniref:HK97-gp10 family putative phage morphogenesis protein n=1 Tax=Bacillus smithii TaxID=1479 RepID=UPI003D22B74C
MSGQEIKGLDQVLKNLNIADKKVQKAIQGAVKKAAELFADRLGENTPRESRLKTGGSVAEDSFKHLADDVVYSGISNVNGTTVVKVGYGKETYWRAHFVEWGTVKQPPQHFVETTEAEIGDRILRLIEREIKGALGL